MTDTIPTHDIVIIGTGVAGTTLVRETRKLDPDVTLAVITADGGEVYSKPMLSNALAQNKTPDALVQKDAETFAHDMNVKVHAHTQVLSVNRADKTLVVDGPSGRVVIGYGRLVLATGASARGYQVDGSGTAPIYTVNNLDDYVHWREALGENARVLLIGAGLIGSEFANDLAVAGHTVDMVDPAPWPLGRLLPEDLGREMARALEGVGIACRMGRTVQSMAKAADGGWVARLDDGAEVAFDVALSAIGLVPNTGLAAAAGLAVGQGIRVDAYMATSDQNIFALGDCAETDAGVLPYILPVMSAARALAKTLTGDAQPVMLPALPVAVKTPALPCVVCPPQPGAVGQWVVDGEGKDRKALFINEIGEAVGFALSGAETKARQAMARDMPDLIASQPLAAE